MIVQRTPISNELPFELSVVAGHCRVDDIPAYAENLTRMASAAAFEFEAYAQVALLDQTITVTLENGTRRGVFDLPIAPLNDALTVEVTIDGLVTDAFAVITGQRPAIRFTNGRPCGFTVITYQAGFGATAAALPQDIANSICDQALALLDTPGAGDGKTNGMSPHMARVAARYRRVSL
jgi:hypothetical protein